MPVLDAVQTFAGAYWLKTPAAKTLHADLVRLQRHLGAIGLQGVGFQNIQSLVRAAERNSALTELAHRVGGFYANGTFKHLGG